MSSISMAGLIFGCMLALMVIRVPIAISMFVAGCFGYIAQVGLPPFFNNLNGMAYARFASYDLSVIPLFILMGNFATQGGISKALFQFASVVMARFKGGLAMAAVMASAAFGAICGSSIATAATITQVALPEMKRHGYSGRLATGTLAAGGTLGILIPPSVMIIVYAAVAGQSVVKLYAAAMFPGFFLAFLYLVYVIGWVMINPKIAPKLPPEQMKADVRPWVQHVSDQYTSRMLPAFAAAVLSPARALRASSAEFRVGWTLMVKSLFTSLIPIFMTVICLGAVWWYVVIYSQADNNAAAAAANAPATVSQPAQETAGSTTTEKVAGGVQEPPGAGGVQLPPGAEGVKEPPGAGGLQEPAGSGGVQEPPGAGGVQLPPGAEGVQAPPGSGEDEPLRAMGDGDTSDAPKTEPVPESFYTGFAVTCGAMLLLLLWYYRNFDAEQFEILDMLVRSVMPLGVLTLVVLGVILFGITTATESAAVGAAGAFLMAWAAGTLNFERIKEAVFLTAKTTSMVCWLFVGSALFSAVFAILGGQRLVEEWVMAMNLSPIQFLLLSQAIIFVLGWPLEWTEIIVIFVPIFLPLLAHFQIDPMLWGVLVFVNLQAAFLSPPVAMSAFYLKGVSPPHVTINQIFAGMMPYMFIVIVCMVLMYIWPQLTLWLPNYLYGK